MTSTIVLPKKIPLKMFQIDAYGQTIIYIHGDNGGEHKITTL